MAVEPSVVANALPIITHPPYRLIGWAQCWAWWTRTLPMEYLQSAEAQGNASDVGELHHAVDAVLNPRGCPPLQVYWVNLSSGT